MQPLSLILLHWVTRAVLGNPVEPKRVPSTRSVGGRDAIRESLSTLASTDLHREIEPTAIPGGQVAPLRNMRSWGIQEVGDRGQTQASQTLTSISALQQVLKKIHAGTEKWQVESGERENLERIIQILKELEGSEKPFVSANNQTPLTHANQFTGASKATANSHAVDRVNRLRSIFTTPAPSTAPPEFAELLDHSVLQTINNDWKKSLIDRETLHSFFDDELTLKKIAFHSMRNRSGGNGIFPQFTVEPTFGSISEFWALLDLDQIIKEMQKRHQRTLTYHAVNFEIGKFESMLKEEKNKQLSQWEMAILNFNPKIKAKLDKIEKTVEELRAGRNVSELVSKEDLINLQTFLNSIIDAFRFAPNGAFKGPKIHQKKYALNYYILDFLKTYYEKNLLQKLSKGRMFSDSYEEVLGMIERSYKIKTLKLNQYQYGKLWMENSTKDLYFKYFSGDTENDSYFRIWCQKNVLNLKLENFRGSTYQTQIEEHEKKNAQTQANLEAKIEHYKAKR